MTIPNAQRDGPTNIREFESPDTSVDMTVFAASTLASGSLFALQRQPHKYGFAFTALGSAPHLEVFAGTAFAQAQRADGFDLTDPSLAMTKCVFELLERVWSPAVGPELTDPVAFADLDPGAADPAGFALLTEAERARLEDDFPPYDKNTMLRWRPGWRVVNADGALAPALLPAVLVHPGFGIAYPEERICPMLSPGLAAGRRADEAILRGLYEVIERDAATAGWLAGVPPQKLTALLLDDAGAETLAALNTDGFDVQLYELTLDIPVPVVLAVVRNDRRAEPFGAGLGLGCHRDLRLAANKAFAECLFVMSARFDFPSGADVARREVDQTKPFGPAELEASLDALAASARPAAEGSGHDLGVADSDELRQLLALLLDRGHRIYLADLTPDDAQDFRLFRALVSDLQPMLYEPVARRLANPRLYQLPCRVGLTDRPLTEDELNLSPHPFIHHVMP